MKKIKVLLMMMIAIGLCLGVANAQTAIQLNVPGSLLVYPLIDNLTDGTRTIVDVVNRAETDVWIKGFIIGHDAGGVFHKKDFVFLLTQKQPIIWQTDRQFRPNGGFVQSYDGIKGFLVLWAIDDDKSQTQIQWDDLKGDAVVIGPGTRAFRYNAIPHQSLPGFVADDVLALDGLTDYAAASQTILCEGFAGGYVQGLDGTLAVANLNINFLTSSQPSFDINIGVWNEDEIYSSRHVDFDQFEQYTLADLQLRKAEIDSDKFQFSTNTNGNALWAVFFQYVGNIAFGGQCFMDPAGVVPTTITLAPVTAQ